MSIRFAAKIRHIGENFRIPDFRATFTDLSGHLKTQTIN